MTPKNDFHWLSGKVGESLFSKPFLSIDELAAWNAEVPEFYRRIEASGDDRSYVLMTALVLEHEYDAFLEVLLPGYRHLRDKQDFTIAMKIGLTSALRLVPTILTRCADLIRRVRNEFAHDIELSSLDQLTARLVSQMKNLHDEAFVDYKETHAGKTVRESFHRVSFCAISGFRRYRPNIKALRSAIDDPGFVAGLQSRADGAFASAIAAMDAAKQKQG